jgi:hypothetical protein
MEIFMSYERMLKMNFVYDLYDLNLFTNVHIIGFPILYKLMS